MSKSGFDNYNDKNNQGNSELSYRATYRFFHEVQKKHQIWVIFIAKISGGNNFAYTEYSTLNNTRYNIHIGILLTDKGHLNPVRYTNYMYHRLFEYLRF